MKSATLALGLALAAAALAPDARAVSVVNGSMDHTGGTNYLYFNGYIAPGWTQDNSGTNPALYVTSPDIFDPVMTAFSMAWVPSTDGGKFAHMLAWIDGENQEGIYQTISGLTVGAEYQILFEQSITDTNFTATGIPGQFQVRFGATTQYSSLMLAPAPNTPYGWSFQALTFTATAATQDLSFLAHSADPATPVYLGLDGVSIREKVTVPEPAAAALAAFALAGAGASRARRPTPARGTARAARETRAS